MFDKDKIEIAAQKKLAMTERKIDRYYLPDDNRKNYTYGGGLLPPFFNQAKNIGVLRRVG